MWAPVHLPPLPLVEALLTQPWGPQRHCLGMRQAWWVLLLGLLASKCCWCEFLPQLSASWQCAWQPPLDALTRIHNNPVIIETEIPTSLCMVIQKSTEVEYEALAGSMQRKVIMK